MASVTPRTYLLTSWFITFTVTLPWSHWWLQLVVEFADTPIRSIEVQLVRVETIIHHDTQAREGQRVGGAGRGSRLGYHTSVSLGPPSSSSSMGRPSDLSDGGSEHPDWGR